MKVIIPAHGEMPLKELATVQLTPGFHNIFHYNGRQTVRLNANIKEEVLNIMHKLYSEGNIPYNF